jgi:uncharacterized tellurite resistance protein B-like protein
VAWLFLPSSSKILMMDDQKFLEGYSGPEKGAYLGAIASLATADRQASEEELEHISSLCDTADLTEPQKQVVLRAATELSGEELQRCLDILKNSELRYSLVTDLISFAKSDENYSEEEEQGVQKIASYLGVDQHQFSLLDQFSQEASTTREPVGEAGGTNFLSGSGLQDKLKNAGINTGGLLKGLLGFAGPMILGSLMSGGLGRGRRGGGLLGGLGGGPMLGGGGLGSLIGMLSGGRGMSSTGGLLGRIFGGR